MINATTCRWCGMIHGPRCQNVKAMEFHEDGTLRRVEFFAPNDWLAPPPPVTKGWRVQFALARGAREKLAEGVERPSLLVREGQR
jgi:hypothetical protein